MFGFGFSYWVVAAAEVTAKMTTATRVEAVERLAPAKKHTNT